jgi:serine/threonine-protein kinase
MGGPRDLPGGSAPDAAAEGSSRYEILARIASGGMATVFVARARGAAGFSRLVAIKRAHPFVSEDAALRRSLVTEAHIASAIHHPHVVSVLDVEMQGNDVCLVLDYVEGCALSELLTKSRRAGNPLPVPVAMRVLLDAASGLHAAHALCDDGGRPLGLVHRDVSPQNILVGVDGHARLTDFGIAKIISDEGDQTAANVLKGKLAYMSPEYLDRKAFDARSDQYALAVVAWEALTGERLFAGDSDVETLRRLARGEAVPPSTLRADLKPFDDVFMQALARAPGARFATVEAFADAMEDRARRLGWVAAHSEVARAVDAAVGDSLRQRRSDLESPGPVSTSRLSKRPPIPAPPISARDVMITRSLPGDSPLLAAAAPPPIAVAVTKSAPIANQLLPRRRRIVLVAAAAAVILVGAVSTVLAVHGRSTRAAANAGETPSADLSSEPVPPPSPAPPDSVPVPVDSPPAASASPAPAASPASPASPPVRRHVPPPARTHSSPIRYHDPG